MSSLADLPELVGFFSYSRDDDEAFKGTLSALRNSIQRELAAQLGRSKKTFRLWQDQAAIAPGKLWESEIKTAVDQSFFFIPIVTPRSINSKYCKFEFELFLAREKALGRNDLIFPILYIAVPALEDEAKWRDDPILSTIGQRQYVDWRPLRHLDVETREVREQIERFCQKIVEALNEPWTPLEERRRIEEAKRAEEERRRAEVEVRRRNEEERAEVDRVAKEERKRAESQAKLKLIEAEARRKATEEAGLSRKAEQQEKERREHPGGKLISQHAILYKVAILQALVVGAAVIATWVNIESIVVSGPALSLIGFLLAWLSGRRSLKLGVAIGLSPVILSLFCLILIWGYNWGPDKAHIPISIIASVYSAFFAACMVWFLFRAIPSSLNR